VANVLNAIGIPKLLVVIIADGMGGGIQVVATLKNAAANKAYTASLAPHDIKGDINTVVTRSLCVSSVRAAIIDFFDIATGVIFVDGVANVLNAIGIPKFLVVIIADGMGGGIQVVATFIPIKSTFQILT
jgi:Fe2+ transport system protein B